MRSASSPRHWDSSWSRTRLPAPTADVPNGGWWCGRRAHRRASCSPAPRARTKSLRSVASTPVGSVLPARRRLRRGLRTHALRRGRVPHRAPNRALRPGRRLPRRRRQPLGPPRPRRRSLISVRRPPRTRFRTRQWVIAPDEVAVERSPVALEGWGARLLALRGPDNRKDLPLGSRRATLLRRCGRAVHQRADRRARRLLRRGRRGSRYPTAGRATDRRRLELRGRERFGALVVRHDDLCARGPAATRAGNWGHGRSQGGAAPRRGLPRRCRRPRSPVREASTPCDPSDSPTTGGCRRTRTAARSTLRSSATTTNPAAGTRCEPSGCWPGTTASTSTAEFSNANRADEPAGTGRARSGAAPPRRSSRPRRLPRAVLRHRAGHHAAVTRRVWRGRGIRRMLKRGSL